MSFGYIFHVSPVAMVDVHWCACCTCEKPYFFVCLLPFASHLQGGGTESCKKLLDMYCNALEHQLSWLVL